LIPEYRIIVMSGSEWWIAMQARPNVPNEARARPRQCLVDMLALIALNNRAGDGTMVVPSEYLEVVIRKH
jgi:hypothetical protein